MTPQILNTIGLALSMFGVVLIFIWGPPLPDFDDSVGLGLQPGTVLADGTRIADIIADNQRRRKRHQIMSRIGLALIFAGFAAQLWAVWL